MVGREVECSSEAFYCQLGVALDTPEIPNLIQDSERVWVL